MNKENLLKLADLLDRVPPKKFDMYSYGTASGPVERARCATACCALGWATAIPEFGLELRASRGRYEADVYDKAKDEFYDGAGGVLGLTQRQADTLFRAGWDMTPKEKAARIREMVETGR